MSCPRTRVAFDVPVKSNDRFGTVRKLPRRSNARWQESGVLSLALPERLCISLVKSALESLSCYALILAGPSEMNQRARPSKHATMNKLSSVLALGMPCPILAALTGSGGLDYARLADWCVCT